MVQRQVVANTTASFGPYLVPCTLCLAVAEVGE